MPWIRRCQFLRVAHNHLDRPVRRFGQVVTKRNVHERCFSAKIASDWTQLKNDLFLIDLKPLCKVRSGHVWAFRRTPNENSPRRIDVDDSRMRLEIAVMDSRSAECLFEDQVGFSETFLGVAE